MHFSDTGIIISKKMFQENSYIISVFTKNNGLYSGIVKSISKKNYSIYMEGNLINFSWQARLHSHIGMVKCELIKSYSSYIFNDKIKLYAFNSIISLIKVTFHEREPHNNFFPLLLYYLNKMNEVFDFYDYIKLELGILAETGYKLSLDTCAVTGNNENLYFVSPKTGKAVSFEAGKHYASKLLKLPIILIRPKADLSIVDYKECFDLTTYFFNRYFFHDKPMLQPRQRFVELMHN